MPLDDIGRFKARLEGPVSGNILQQEELTHPLLDSRLPLALPPFAQARIMARVLRGDVATYLPFLTR